MRIKLLRIALAASFALLLLVFLPLPFEPELPGRWCDDGAIWRDCYRNWLGSLAGWAAFAGALLGSALLIEHLNQLRRQSDLSLAQLQRHDLILTSAEGRGGIILRRTASAIKRRAAIMALSLKHKRPIEMHRFAEDLKGDELSWARQVAPIEVLGPFIHLEDHCGSFDAQIASLGNINISNSVAYVTRLKIIEAQADAVLNAEHTSVVSKFRPHFNTPPGDEKS
ncbi:hypothetical protein A7A08_01855 [Methyloligella halotolerans]|uniref:Uncharacterized protein n=1 Tax=Methyloligella halotolerans TaxID=1177755 RepID=A0A1E2RYI6_9HYPH|nr:hypothetical protein [Methyloligella halotolerans]ODA67109.1 hypothetical protein A7A08_01855 [Methyloligella halotolerans]